LPDSGHITIIDGVVVPREAWALERWVEQASEP
jgi:hypothetical protein